MTLQDQFDSWKLDLITEFTELVNEMERERTYWDNTRAERRRYERVYDMHAFERVRSLSDKILRAKHFLDTVIPSYNMEDYLDVQEEHVALRARSIVRIPDRLVLRLPSVESIIRLALAD